jgi:hypothetical protein
VLGGIVMRLEFLCVFGLTFQEPDIFSIPAEAGEVWKSIQETGDDYYHSYGNIIDIEA